MIPLVVAGGQGTKLWPYSRQDKPKQFQPIIGDKSLYQSNVETLLEQYSPEDIYVSTKRKFIRYISEQTPQIPLRNYILEPDISKDRGPGEGLAFARLSKLRPEEPFFLVQADCLREPDRDFLNMMSEAEKLVKRDKKFLTGGIKATQPVLGVDYLQLGKQIESKSDQQIFEVDEFVGRKDSYAETKQLITDYHIVTHCNHACWYPDLMLDAYKKYRPDWHKALLKIRDAFDKPGENEAIEQIYASMEKGPTEEVTKHVMHKEKAEIMLLPFKWTDVGTWGSVYDQMTGGNGHAVNHYEGHVVEVDNEGTYIKSSDTQKLIAAAGLKDLVVVDTDDVLLIIPKDKMEKIKDIHKLLAKDHKKYL